MLFNSFIFIFLFLPLTYFFWRIACSFENVKVPCFVLLLASIIFYGYWNPPYLLLLIVSIVFNYVIQHKIAKSADTSNARPYLVISVLFNLFLIAYFKYADFLGGNIAALFRNKWEALNIFLPLGISFFTFQQIACIVDTYKKKIGSVSFAEYALFVSFFPQLIAGPIVLADKMLPQFSDKETFKFSWENLYIGLSFFAIGLFKKALIADTFSPWVAVTYEGNAVLSFGQAWGGSIFYMLQLYYDFSGYSDMAIGLGRMFNIDLPINFDSPYKSSSITEFWHRWHITLSLFLKDYVYIPLGGNRKGKLRKYCNLIITMLLGGLWHGAGWNYVIWGGLHGLFLTVNHAWHSLGYRMPKILGKIITIVSVAAAFAFFRSSDLNSAFRLLRAMFGFNGYKTIESVFHIGNQAPVIVISVLMMFMPNTYQLVAMKNKNKIVSRIFPFFIAIVFVSALMMLNNISEFLYFQF